MTLSPRSWLKEFLWRLFCGYFLLYSTSISFDYYLLPNVTTWLGPLFQKAANFTGSLFFGVTLTGEHEFYSDSLLNYVHVFNCLLLSTIIAIIWTWKSKQNFSGTKFYPWFLVALRYFVALNMFVYGFSKLYKWQFMYPEPNLLYQAVGNTPRDLLYWTSMGTSYTYCVFMGIIEIVPGILLLFRRTALAGAILSALVLSNVVAVNLGFDITVKIHSITLVLMSLLLIVPARKRLFAFFSGKPTEEWKYPAITWQPKQKWILPSLKIACVALLFTESNYPYFETMNFNDDKAERPPMHGAYEIVDLHYSEYPWADGPIYIDDDGLQYVFIHRRGYIIFQSTNAPLRDYPVEIDTTNHKFIFDQKPGDNEFEELEWEKLDDSTFVFRGTYNDVLVSWEVKKLDLKKLPLLQEEFGWIDEQ